MEELLAKNLAAWEGELFEPKSPDSSFKKNSAFVKRLAKSITKDSQDSIIRDISQLSLSKYTSEIIIAVQEGLIKCKTVDTSAATEIVSLLHQRFCPEFTSKLLTWFYQELESPLNASGPKEEKDHMTKAKVLIRMLTIFAGVGIFHSINDTLDQPHWVMMRKQTTDSIIVLCLKEVLAFKLRTGITLSLAQTFVKRFSSLVEKDEGIRAVLKTYTEVVVQRTESLHKKVKDLVQRKYKAQIRTGRILEELETELNEMGELLENFKTASEVLAPVLGVDLPLLEEDGMDEEMAEVADSVIISKDGAFQNDEEKRFYQTLPELPQELIDEANADETNVSKGEEMTDFLLQLETASTMKDIDECVLQFWRLKLCNKASKNRLVKHFITSKEIGKCKVYARFIKSNKPYLEDIQEELLTYLDQGFRSQIHHNGLNFKNIVFFCELIKFELVPEHVAFHKIRSLILNLTTPNNIEILSIFFEFCGKYLLNEHNTLMEEMLVLLEMKRKTDKLTINNKMAISNLFLVLKPPSIKSLQSQAKNYTPEQLFLKQIIRNELTSRTVKNIRKIVNAVDLTDPELQKTMMALFTKPNKLRYENVPALSQVLKTMPRNFKIAVVDTVLENILRGMEVNDYRYNRIRLSQCYYISQIYELGIIGVMVVHDLIFKILTFGHPNNSPNPMELSEIDLPDEYFRIQLVCILLQNSSMGSDKMKDRLDVLLHFFDYYIWIKEQPIPKEIDFKIVNCFNKYSFSRAPSGREAIERLSEVVKTKGFANGEGDDDDDEEEDEEEEEDDEDEDDDEDDEDDDDDEEDEERSDIDMSKPSDEEKEAQLSYEAYEKKLLEEEEKRIEEKLEKEFKKMVFDSMHAQKSDKAAVDLPKTITVNTPQTGATNGIDTTSGKVAFKLVTRGSKGRLDTRELNVPKDVRLATNVVAGEQKTRLEKEKLTKYILKSATSWD
ncbi:Nonsense-mediated mRNA decay protein 2 [Cyberlindnera fabianii]|uniref:Nonsense-mediated mRNA decay protein 2 n=1 Tax=Cyberlindnera fabianii TaxID=36022 RepID=A0A1V2KZ22_CYBFA|nr:Nonsense-mediated mRNA decay protein 2 [Cyberlindnera fabianii]